jgi:hypothetical protein
MGDKLVTVATFPTPHEAQLAKMQLESADIAAVVCDEMTVGMVWHLGPALGGVRVQVAEEDAERAESILSGAQPTEKVDHPSEQLPYRKAASREQELDEIVPTRAADETARRAFRAAIIGLVLCPGIFHVYSAGLLWSLKTGRQELSVSGRRNFLAAAILDGLVLATLMLLIAMKMS